MFRGRQSYPRPRLEPSLVLAVPRVLGDPKGVDRTTWDALPVGDRRDPVRKDTRTVPGTIPVTGRRTRVEGDGDV